MPRNYQEVPDQGGMFFNFKEKGDTVEGILIAIRDEQGKFGPQKVYDIIPDNGEDVVTVGGTHDIDAKMQHAKIGQACVITFREELPNGVNKTVKKFKIGLVDVPAEEVAQAKARVDAAKKRKEGAPTNGTPAPQQQGSAPF